MFGQKNQDCLRVPRSFSGKNMEEKTSSLSGRTQNMTQPLAERIQDAMVERMRLWSVVRLASILDQFPKEKLVQNVNGQQSVRRPLDKTYFPRMIQISEK